MSDRALASAQKQTARVTPSRSGFLQRKCACGQHTIAGGECAECKKEKGLLQRASLSPRGRATGGEGKVPSIVHEVLRSPGQPLNAATRAYMEPRFGYDFSGVRVHTDAKAAESASAVNALAYTVGRDVVFGGGLYASTTHSGRRLLAHELTHVVQQRGVSEAWSAEHLTIGPSHSAAELDAHRIGARVGAGGSATGSAGTRHSGSAPMISRADPDAVGYTMRLGTSARTGIQFWRPTSPTPGLGRSSPRVD